MSKWFVTNVRDARWVRSDKFGAAALFDVPDAHFEELGINIRVLEPGQPASLYHAESAQEDFLVLRGECVLVVEGEERRLRAWDFVHCPPLTKHVFVGAGEEPCVILMVGARNPGLDIVYPVEPAAQKHGAGVETESHSGPEAYAPYGPPQPGKPDGWDALPWATEP
ncbi:MAG TPA: cupin domain-containing protein [Gaiellaceae bacterium]|nr:cupin domain-containing protein [Gaiellaceae bacterium]